MKKNPNLLWITVLVLGWLFDFLFWKQSIGVNFAIFALLCLVGGFFILWMDKQRPARGTLWLVPFIVFFAAITFIRAEPMTAFLGFVFTLFLMGILAVTFLGGRWMQYGVVDYIYKFLQLGGSVIVRAGEFSAQVRNERIESGVPRPKVNLWPVARGILIALPIVLIFGGLLASADVIFSNQLNSILKLFSLERFPQYIFRLIYILVIAYLLASVFLHAATKSKDEKLIGEEKPLISQFLGFTESAIVLGSVIVLFAAFVFIQFKYFFGGHANIHIDGFTYSEYARRGFGELVAVAFFSLLLLLGLSTITRREDEVHRRVFSGLGIGLVALVLVMLVSAYQRLVLYETAYGFSRLRTYTHVFLIWIGLLLIVTVVLEIFRRERAFALSALLASLGFALSLSLLNVDGFIVRQNVNRAVQGAGLDVPYLVSLSTDSVPVLTDIYQSSSYPGLTRDAVGAVLFCRLQTKTNDSTDQDWRSFSFPSWKADMDLKTVKSRLNGYQVNDDSWPIRILTPGHVAYDCYGSGSD
ncbi:MAG TPA: DUF4173 domain-containing protein [Anaerolineales bacterium]|nr:DUF4173 domain-containing protein [Anaerolineales bacterium]